MKFSLDAAIPLNFYILNKYVYQIIQAEILDKKDLSFSSEHYTRISIVIALKGGYRVFKICAFSHKIPVYQSEKSGHTNNNEKLTSINPILQIYKQISLPMQKAAIKLMFAESDP